MKTPDWFSDPQWTRAIGAVALAVLAVYGVGRAGGPVAVAREAEPVARVVAEVYCAASSALIGGRTARPRGLRRGG
jgi:branched-subunit amino acid permease